MQSDDRRKPKHQRTSATSQHRDPTARNGSGSLNDVSVLESNTGSDGDHERAPSYTDNSSGYQPHDSERSSDGSSKNSPSSVDIESLVEAASSGALAGEHADLRQDEQLKQLQEILDNVGRFMRVNRQFESLVSLLQVHLLDPSAVSMPKTFRESMSILQKALRKIVDDHDGSVNISSNNVMQLLSLSAGVLLTIGLHQCCVDPRAAALFRALIAVTVMQKDASTAESHVLPLSHVVSQHIDSFAKSDLGCDCVLSMLPELRLGLKIRRRVIDKMLTLSVHPNGKRVVVAFFNHVGTISKAVAAILVHGAGRSGKPSATSTDELPPFIHLACHNDALEVCEVILDLASAPLRLYLTDMIHTYRERLEDPKSGQHLLEWAEGKATLRTAVAVRDASSGVDFVVPNSAVIETAAVRAWRDSGAHALLRTVPMLCRDFEAGSCSQSTECPAVHLMPGTFDEIRPKTKSCCWHHDGDCASGYEPYKSYQYRIQRDDGLHLQAVPVVELALSGALLRRTKESPPGSLLTLKMSELCRAHRKGTCKKPEQCHYFHLCKATYDRVSAQAAAAKQESSLHGEPGSPEAEPPLSELRGESFISSTSTPQPADLGPNVVRTYRATSDSHRKTNSNSTDGASWEETRQSTRAFRVVREVVPLAQRTHVEDDRSSQSHSSASAFSRGSLPRFRALAQDPLADGVVQQEHRLRRTPGGHASTSSAGTNGQTWNALSGAPFEWEQKTPKLGRTGSQDSSLNSARRVHNPYSSPTIPSKSPNGTSPFLRHLDQPAPPPPSFDQVQLAVANGMLAAPPPPPPPPAPQLRSFQSHTADDHRGSKPRGSPKAAMNSVPECKYFKLGCCSKGTKCTFLHNPASAPRRLTPVQQ